MLDIPTLAARFHELGRKKAELQAAAAPTRAQYETMRAEQCAIMDRMKPIQAKLRELEAPIYDIDVERAQISRALGGRTGEPG